MPYQSHAALVSRLADEKSKQIDCLYKSAGQQDTISTSCAIVLSIYCASNHGSRQNTSFEHFGHISASIPPTSPHMWRHAFKLPEKHDHQSGLQHQVANTSLTADIDAVWADPSPPSDRDSFTAEDLEGFLCDWANEAFREGEDYAIDFYHYFGNSPWVYAQFRFWCQRMRRLDLERNLPHPVLPLDFSGLPPSYADTFDELPSYTLALEQSPAPPPFDRYSQEVIAQFREERAQFPVVTVRHHRSPLPEILEFFSPSIGRRSLWGTAIPPASTAPTLPTAEWIFDESSPISAFWAQLMRALPPIVPPPTRSVFNEHIATQSHSRPSSEVHDQVIVLLAERAAANSDFRNLMRTVADSQATQEQLQAFRGHIDELEGLVETPTPSLSQTSSPTASASEPATPESNL